ncbi:hypothetical protein F5H01DRAFT_352097 [Linnemannia elongata]|nr:hypothetical protein F5H01DRAFT_352097 [Linnemannia elongata]
MVLLGLVQGSLQTVLLLLERVLQPTNTSLQRHDIVLKTLGLVLGLVSTDDIVLLCSLQTVDLGQQVFDLLGLSLEILGDFVGMSKFLLFFEQLLTQ